MKQFDLETYNRLVSEGETPKVATREGKNVRIVCTDRLGVRPIIALHDSNECVELGLHYPNGHHCVNGISANDLFFADTEPTYRPYKDAEECFKDVQQHSFLIRAKRVKAYHLIVTITSSHIWLGNASEGIPMDRLLDGFEYTDGQPCGVKEDCDA